MKAKITLVLIFCLSLTQSFASSPVATLEDCTPAIRTARQDKGHLNETILHVLDETAAKLAEVYVSCDPTPKRFALFIKTYMQNLKEAFGQTTGLSTDDIEEKFKKNPLWYLFLGFIDDPTKEGETTFENLCLQPHIMYALEIAIKDKQYLKNTNAAKLTRQKYYWINNSISARFCNILNTLFHEMHPFMSGITEETWTFYLTLQKITRESILPPLLVQMQTDIQGDLAALQAWVSTTPGFLSPQPAQAAAAGNDSETQRNDSDDESNTAADIATPMPSAPTIQALIDRQQTQREQTIELLKQFKINRNSPGA